MNKQEIANFYKSYKNQILNEMKEYLDMPLKNIKIKNVIKNRIIKNLYL
jgi:hypothetical protein